MRKYIIAIFSLALMQVSLFTACKADKEVEIVILTTNDMHGRIDNFPKLAAYVKQMKIQHKHVLLFSAGDMFSGNPLIDQYPERGYPFIDIMNHIGYDLATFGNHEFDYGQQALADRLKQAKFPFLLANAEITDRNVPLPTFVPYKTLDIGGIKMTVVSVIEVGSGGTPSTHPDKVKGITFYNPVEKIQEYKKLRTDCDVFIALTHVGVEPDVEIAKAMPELDVILGGHSHTRIDTGMLVNGVLITQSDSWLKYVGQTILKVKNGKVISKSNRLIDLAKLTETDNDIQKLIDDYKAKDVGNTAIGKAIADITGKPALGALMTDAITSELGVDIAFQNAGGIRIPKIPAGNITVNMIYSLDPFGNEVVKINMTYDEIKGLLESSLRKSSEGVNPELIASGINYKAVVNKNGELKSLEIKDKNGKPLDKKRTYAVGMNSYIYSKFRFAHADPGASLNITSAETLINYIKNKKTVDYSNINRIQVEQIQ